MKVTSDGTVTVRTSWYMGTDFNAGLAPSKMSSILEQLRSGGVLPWIVAGDIPKLSQQIGFSKFDQGQPFNSAHGIAFDVYVLIGPPPNVAVAINRQDDGGLDMIIQQPLVVPSPVDTAKQVTLSQIVRSKIATAIEQYTKLPMPAKSKALLQSEGLAWHVNVSPDQKGVETILTKKDMELVYGVREWDGYLKKPAPPTQSGGFLPTGEGGMQFDDDVPEAEREYFIAWMKRVEGDHAGGGGATHVTKKLVDAMHAIDADPNKDKIEAKLHADEKGDPQPLTWQMLDAAKARVDLGKDAPGKTYKPLFPEPVVGHIINRGDLNYLGQETEFYFRCENHHDAFAVPELSAEWLVTKRGENKTIGSGTTKSIDISTSQPDYFAFEWPEVGVYTIHAFVSHTFYQSAHFEINVEVKTEADRTKQINDGAFNGLQGNPANTVTDTNHKFDTSWTNNQLGSNKETHGAMSVGELPPNFQHMSYADRVKFIATKRKNLDDMIAAHKDSKDPQWADTLSYAQDQLAKITELQATLDTENSDGATFFDARGTFLSRKNGIRDKALTLVASAKKADGQITITIHDLSQVYEPKDYTFTQSGATWADAIEKVFVDLCKSYPPGRISCLFEALDDEAKPTKTTRGFELDTGTAWKDTKAVLYNSKVQAAINIAGAATMIFFPLSAPFLFPALAAYNSVGTIDNLAELSTKGVLDKQSVATPASPRSASTCCRTSASSNRSRTSARSRSTRSTGSPSPARRA